MSADLKYTDRDVRENDELTEAAYEYIEQYTGEFAFIIDCKMRVASGESLTVGMVRGILNCMRVDPRVRNMPTPLPPDETVVAFERPPRRQFRQLPRYQRKACDIEKYHGPHGGAGDSEYHFCHGKYAINRGGYSYRRDAYLHDDILYVAGKSPTTLLHKTMVPHWTRDPKQPSAAYEWFPEQHGWGWAFRPKLRVFPYCKTPQNLVQPILLTEENMTIMQSDEELWRPRCHRCFG
jgi:hypothetical protein